ncbi:hypothetical protein SLEP1_g56627 [Rubroshorea leprosula]|uniref:Uncharacterized protein n=1 Tax=Rubroshorea leprosula TaxID=152421 RepID=A0AAV5MKA6_9ROSI|nr:hypothetical protein SLEP1_g56627 [Rubroshorea leprosula]
MPGFHRDPSPGFLGTQAWNLGRLSLKEPNPVLQNQPKRLKLSLPNPL